MLTCKNCGRGVAAWNRSGFCSRCHSDGTRYRVDSAYREHVQARNRQYARALKSDPRRRASYNAKQLAWDRRRSGRCVNCGIKLCPGNVRGYCGRRLCYNAYLRWRGRIDPAWREEVRARQRARRARRRVETARYDRQWRRRRQLQALRQAVQRIVESNPANVAEVVQTSIERVTP